MRTPTLDESLNWMGTGTNLCLRAIGGLHDDDFAQPSALPDWTRAHVVAHIDGNARALANLVTWASTGVETPMYASPEQRNADIAAGAAMAPAQLRARFAESADELAAGLSVLTGAQWAAEVRTVQGRMIPASMIPWLRSREVLIHAFDLNAGVGFDEFPDAFLVALIDDVVQRRSSMEGHPALVIEAGGRRWEVTGSGESVLVSGTLAQVGAYVAGRGELGPDIPAWL